MREGQEALMGELSDIIRKGNNAKQLMDAQGEILETIKSEILKEMAMASSVKTVTVKRFWLFTVKEESRTGVEHMEQLQAHLRVILGYEALLKSNQSDSEVAKLNLEQLQSRP